MTEYQCQQTQLKAGGITKAEVTIMAICGAAPAMCIGGSIGLLALQTGRGVSLAAMVATFVAIFIGLSYGALSEKYNRCGGTYAYIQQLFGDRAGLWTAFIYFGVLITTAGCPPTIFAVYLNYLFPSIPMWLGFFIIVVPICIVTWFGIDLTAKTLIGIWIAQMILLTWPAIKIITMSTTGFDFGTSMTNAFIPNLGVSGLMLAVLTWIWAYVGFEAPAYMGEELKGGSKAVKFAIPMSALAVGFIYVIACWVWTSTLTNDQLTQIQGSGTFLADYATLVGYAAGDKLVAIATMVSALACAFAFYSLMPRFLFDLGREGILPKALAKVNSHQIPHISMITYGCIAFLATLYGCYGYSQSLFFNGVNDWFVIMGISASIAYGFICIGNIKNKWYDKSLWKGIILGKFIPAITTLVLIYMVWASGPKYRWFTLIWIILAFVFTLTARTSKPNATNVRVSECE